MHAQRAGQWLAVGVLMIALGASRVFAATTGVVKLDPQASVIKWTGKKITGQHTGTVKLKAGQVTLENGQISGGWVEVDMPTIVDEDLTDPAYNMKLITHLKSADFFDVEKHPVATFKITEVTSLPAGQAATHEITGDLTIKGITHPVSLPAVVTMQDGQAQARGTLVVDRTLWDIRYGSGKFFENLGDKMIHDTFSLDLDLKGTS